MMLLISWQLRGQTNYFPLDTLTNDDIKLELINFRYGHTYQFTTTITNDSVFLIMPLGVPKGYYEAYYNNDTNCLALVYYNYGARTYGQQFYADGSMKGDTEYNRLGDFHGLHVIYDRKGEEVWHAEYNFGVLEPEYDLNYLEVDNSTAILLKNKGAFGTYEFTPTPSRSRRDRIYLREDSTFTYECSRSRCHWCDRYEGKWEAESDFIILTLKEKNVWRTDSRKFALAANVQLTRIELIEVKDWGVEWYNSEYRKVKN